MRQASLGAAIAGGLFLAPSIGATTIVPIAYSDQTGGFFQSVKNGFSYDYTFTLDEAGYITASLTSSAVTNPINFTSVTLNGVALTKSLTDNSYYLTDPIQALAGLVTLHVEGTASNKATTYSGTVQYIAAIPEPASWMMTIGGFALVGGAMRRKKTARLTFA